MLANVSEVLQWFAGGSEHPYHKLQQCLMGDTPWVTLTVVLDLAVALGYVYIAYHWWSNSRLLKPTPAKRALSTMRNIFLFCGLCGYLFIPVKMFWPAWRLYDMVMMVLVFFTWRYALSARGLRVIYNEMGKSQQLSSDLEKSREESRRKGYFLNAISHDLRTPLNGLMLQANLAEVGLLSGDPQTTAAAVSEIKSSAKATADLLNGFLEYARLDWATEANVHTRFDLAQFASESISIMQANADEKRLLLRAQVPTGAAVYTDRSKLERIVQNLLSNAIKFTEVGGIRMEMEIDSSMLKIHVIDTGPGIDPNFKERLFEEFFQLHNHERDRRKGFGLGLTIARRLARQLGGDVTLESVIAHGSRFTVTLPGAVADPERPAGPTAGRELSLSATEN